MDYSCLVNKNGYICTVLKTTLIMEAKSIVDVAIEFDKKFINESAFSLSDTGVNHRLITYWDNKGLLNKQNIDSKWRKFNFEELIWIRLISKLRQFNIGVETIKEIKNELFQPIGLTEVIGRSDVEKSYSNIVAMEKDEKELVEGLKNLNSEQITNVSISGFKMLLQRVYMEKFNFSILVTLKNNTEKEEGDLTSKIRSYLYCPELHEELSKSVNYQEIFSKTYISISVTELLEDVIVNINPNKFPVDLIHLTDNEQIIIQAIRTGRYKAITVRFKDKKEPYMMELSEVKKVKMESRLYEMIHKGEYKNIEMLVENGDVIHCTSKIRVKMK